MVLFFNFFVSTHYQRLLNYIRPDIVHVMYKGQIIRTGGADLALELEEKGYEWLTGEKEEEDAADLAAPKA